MEMTTETLEELVGFLNESGEDLSKQHHWATYELKAAQDTKWSIREDAEYILTYGWLQNRANLSQVRTLWDMNGLKDLIRPLLPKMDKNSGLYQALMVEFLGSHET